MSDGPDTSLELAVLFAFVREPDKDGWEGEAHYWDIPDGVMGLYHGHSTPESWELTTFGNERELRFCGFGHILSRFQDSEFRKRYGLERDTIEDDEKLAPTRATLPEG